MFDPLGFGSNQTLINQGLISADVAGQSIVVNPTTFSNQGTVEAINGATLRVGDAGQGTMPWTNTGTLRVGAGSVLQLGGIFTLGSTTVQNSGGSLQLFGRLNNAGHTLTLDSPNNSMGLYNACTIAGGSVSVSNGALVVPSDGGGNLDGVALSGDVTTSSRLALLNGTSFTGNIRIPDGGRLDIGAYPYAQYVLSTGTVQFDGNTTYPTLGADNLVIGPNVLVHGGNGQFGRTANNSGTWSWVNQGRISADVPGKRILVNGVDNYGTLEAINGGTLSVGGTFEPGSVLRAINSTFEMLGGPAALIGSMERTNATVNLGGVIDNGGNVLNMDAATQWGFMGGVRFKGGTVNLAPGANFTLGVGIPAQPITLENLAFNGDMVTSPTQLEVDIRHLALNGILTLRTPLSKAVFIDDQTFSSGTIFFDPSGGPGQRQVTPRGLGPNGEGFSTIIFGPSAVLRGGDGLIRLSWGAGALGTFINQGLVSADIANTVIGIEQQRFVNTGIVQAINGGEIDYQGPPPFSGGDPWVLQNSGTLFAGAGSRLLLDALESSSDSVLRFAIGGLADYGQISASSIQFDGTLLVTLEDGFVPASGERFSLLSYGTGSGQFAAIDLPSLPQGLSWNTSGLYETGSIQIVPAPAALSLLAGFVLLRRRRRA